MSTQIAKEELNSLTSFQRDIHVTESLAENIISVHYRSFMKSTWYSSVPVKLKCTTDGNEIVYAVNNSFHFLMYSFMRFILPPVKVKSEYKGRVRIAWCHNVGTNIVLQASFKEDDDTYHTWDNVWADIFFQFYQTPGSGKRKAHNIGIGNVRCLEEWSEFLPSYPINVEQPWFYSMDPALSFPIFYKNSQTRAEHRYTFRRKITDLLRVQLLGKDGKWKDTVRKVHRYLDITQTSYIKMPELWGRYSYVTEPEIRWNKCQTSRIFYTRDVELCDTQNPNVYKTTAEITLHSSKPCLAFFWVAENRTASINHNYSNYTTDTQDLYSGWDPIRTTTLKYETATRFHNMPSDHFSIAEPRKHFLSAPSERGYHAYSYALDSTGFHGDIGIVLTNMGAKLSCTIDNNNIYTAASYEDEEEDDKEEDDIVDSLLTKGTTTKIQEVKQEGLIEETSPQFITRVRLLVVRKFTITLGAKGKYEFLIE